MQVRLNKFLSGNGIVSRRKADELILQGLVAVNGTVIRRLGTVVDAMNDRITYQGKLVKVQEKKTLVYALYKPKNCVTTMEDPQGRVKIVDFFPQKKDRFFPIGRLDYATEGLIFLTNNGEFANLIANPHSNVRKYYFVKIKGILSEADLRAMNGNFMLNGKKLKKMRVKILHHVNDKTWLEFVLNEGKNRQIRRVLEKLNYRVQKIKRFKIGNIDLGLLNPGEYRLLGKEEIKQLTELYTA